jgi:hypothetical protein
MNQGAFHTANVKINLLSVYDFNHKKIKQPTFIKLCFSHL